MERLFVGLATEARFQTGTRIFSFSTTSKPALVSSSLLSKGCKGSSSWQMIYQIYIWCPEKTISSTQKPFFLRKETELHFTKCCFLIKIWTIENFQKIETSCCEFSASSEKKSGRQITRQICPRGHLVVVTERKLHASFSTLKSARFSCVFTNWLVSA
jgi:hypothetical protein